MFARTKTSKLARRTLGALRLTRSFLLLEDDYDVDWEVDRDEDQTQTHPHRVSLRGPGRRSRKARERRRAGELAPARQICLTPVYAPKGNTAGTSRTRPPRTRLRRQTPHSHH